MMLKILGCIYIGMWIYTTIVWVREIYKEIKQLKQNPELGIKPLRKLILINLTWLLFAPIVVIALGTRRLFE